jgi:SAM-dependent methyltransferase
MKLFRRDLLGRLRYKFLHGPAGFGRPIAREVLDEEYRSGAWDHFHETPELPRQSVIVGYVSQLFKHPAILDVGCGSGRLAELFQPHSFRRYLGLDLSPEGIRLARQLPLTRCEFQEANFETWRPAESFDVIIFSESIGYARDPAELVASYLPALASGGIVAISHFRSAHWPALWERAARHLTAFESVVIANAKGQTWDIKLLRPAARP